MVIDALDIIAIVVMAVCTLILYTGWVKSRGRTFRSSHWINREATEIICKILGNIAFIVLIVEKVN